MSPHEIYDPETGELEERRSYVPAIASLSSALMFGAVALWSVSTSGVGIPGGPPSLPDLAAGAPNAPVISSITQVVDSVTFRVNGGSFSGSQDDTQDSARVLVDTAGGDFTNPIVDSIMGPQTVDTVSATFASGATYDFIMQYKGTSGGWSDSSSVAQKTVLFRPEAIDDLAVVSASDSSLTLQWTTVADGTGSKAVHNIRYKNITGDSASFSWGGTQEFNDQLFDSTGTSIGETVTLEITGLTSGDKYEFGNLAYRGEPDVDAVYASPVPQSGSTTAIGTVTGSTPQDTTDTPTITVSQGSDTSTVILAGSGFSGGSQTHDSTRWRLDNNSDMSSPFYDVTSTSNLVRDTVIDNVNLTEGNTYHGTAQYFGSLDASQVSATDNVTITAPTVGEFNEPSDFEELRSWDGSALTPTGWTEQDSGPAKHSRFVDATAPSGNSHIYRHTYPQGLQGGAGTEYNYTGFPNPFFNVDFLYFRYYLRVSCDGCSWQNHQVGNKIHYFGGKMTSGGAQGVNFYAMIANHDNQLYQIRLQGDVEGGNRTTDRNWKWNDPDNAVFDAGNVSSSDVNIEEDVWHLIEFWGRANSGAGNADGAFKVWIDGKLVMDFDANYAIATNANNYPDDYEFQQGQWKQFLTDAIWGGLGDEMLNEQFLDFDDIYMSGK